MLEASVLVAWSSAHTLSFPVRLRSLTLGLKYQQTLQSAGCLGRCICFVFSNERSENLPFEKECPRQLRWAALRISRQTLHALSKEVAAGHGERGDGPKSACSRVPITGIPLRTLQLTHIDDQMAEVTKNPNIFALERYKLPEDNGYLLEALIARSSIQNMHAHLGAQLYTIIETNPTPGASSTPSPGSVKDRPFLSKMIRSVMWDVGVVSEGARAEGG